MNANLQGGNKLNIQTFTLTTLTLNVGLLWKPAATSRSRRK